MEHSNYLTFALDLARDSGAIMRQNFIMGMKKEWKSDATPLTETDTKIHELVEGAITRAYPDHVLMSEEGEDANVQGAEYVWICDPVDGTHNFSHGIPTATFMLSLSKNGEAILAIIYDPFMDRMYYAEKGKGAFLNGKEIHVADNDTVKKSVIGLGKWNDGVVNLFPVAEELRTRGVRLVTGLSIGYMGALVAAGEFTATLFGGKDPHDMVAIDLLVREAGGVSTDLFGEVKPSHEKVMGQLASNGRVHEEILSIITAHGGK